MSEISPRGDLVFDDITYTKKDFVATVTIQRPHAYNSYTTKTLRELGEAFTDASRDDGVGVVVLTGAGEEAFCTGGDVKEYARDYTARPRDYWKYMGYFAGVVDAIKNLGKPAIARINGMAVGGGNELNLACDLAVAADHARFKQVGVQVGSVAAGGATQGLPIVIGGILSFTTLDNSLLKTNLDVVGKTGAGMHDGGRMNHDVFTIPVWGRKSPSDRLLPPASL